MLHDVCSDGTNEDRNVVNVDASNSEITEDENTGDNEMWSSVESGVNGLAAPCSRAKHSATLLGGHVYVLGGRGAGGAVPLRDFWRYSLATGVWEKLESRGEPPPSLQEHSVVAHQHKLYVFGGEVAPSNDTPLWIYDTETQIWRKLPGQCSTPSVRRRTPRETKGPAPGPRGRRGHSAHALKDCLLIYGGYKDLRGSTNELWAFHYESESWHQVRTAGAGPARHRHGAVLHDARLYVHGGQCDLRDCADLWYYDTMARTWTQVMRGGRAWPGARAGHACARAGAHMYVFGGETRGSSTNELWRFHFASETWEQIIQGMTWPSPRVDGAALLVPAAPLRVRSAPREGGGGGAAGEAGAAGAGMLLSKLSSFHRRRAARCSYSALAAERDSTESLVPALSKSHSAFMMDKRRPPSPPEGDVPDSRRDLSREPISVPDFADMVLPTPVLSTVEATKLVYLDSEEEEEVRRDMESARKRDGDPAGRTDRGTVVALPKSASVRFRKDPTVVTDEEDTEMSTSDYASAEKVNRLSGVSLGFSNPHYLGPDVRALGLALTPDSGVSPGDIELTDMRPPRAPSTPALVLLLVGGREPPHAARLQSPLSMWTYRLL